jgi:hypothetical protein
MTRHLWSVLGLRAMMVLVAEGAGLLSLRRPPAAARWYGAWMLATAFGFTLALLLWIARGVGPGGRLLRLDPCWSPPRYPPRLRDATQALSATGLRSPSAEATPTDLRS